MKKLERCKIENTNQFWTHYLSLEKELQEISEYVAIDWRNKTIFSFKIMQLYFAVCTDIDSIFKHIRSNIPNYANIIEENNLTIKDHKAMIDNHFPNIKQTKVGINFGGSSLEFQPFKALFDFHKKKKEEQKRENGKYDKSKSEGWWSDYNSVKHSRLDSFHKANLDNLLQSLSALHILNLIYQVSLRQEWREDYHTIIIQAPAISHYPFLQLKNAVCTKYPCSPYNFYASSLNNKEIDVRNI